MVVRYRTNGVIVMVNYRVTQVRNGQPNAWTVVVVYDNGSALPSIHTCDADRRAGRR
jgi:hypothetical protein